MDQATRHHCLSFLFRDFALQVRSDPEKASLLSSLDLLRLVVAAGPPLFDHLASFQEVDFLQSLRQRLILLRQARSYELLSDDDELRQLEGILEGRLSIGPFAGQQVPPQCLREPDIYAALYGAVERTIPHFSAQTEEFRSWNSVSESLRRKVKLELRNLEGPWRVKLEDGNSVPLVVDHCGDFVVFGTKYRLDSAHLKFNWENAGMPHVNQTRDSYAFDGSTITWTTNNAEYPRIFWEVRQLRSWNLRPPYWSGYDMHLVELVL